MRLQEKDGANEELRLEPTLQLNKLVFYLRMEMLLQNLLFSIPPMTIPPMMMQLFLAPPMMLLCKQQSSILPMQLCKLLSITTNQMQQCKLLSNPTNQMQLCKLIYIPTK